MARTSTITTTSTRTDVPSKERVAGALKRHFFLRIHMAVILGGTIAAGVFTTKLLLMIHERSLALRYGVAVVAGFAVFLGLIKLWLAYVGFCASSARRSSGGGDDWFQVLDFDCDGVGVSAGSGIEGPDVDVGEGSSFGGGGAGGSWGEPVKSSGGSSFSLGDVDFGDDLGLVILIALVVLAIALSAFYVIWIAPTLLSEAAFQAVLAATLARRAKKISSGSWQRSVLRSTAIPFVVVLALAVTLGWYAQKRCPSAMRLRDAAHCVTTR